MKVVDIQPHEFGICELCGNRLRVAFVTDDGKMVCKKCAEGIDWVNARRLWKDYRRGERLKRRIEEDRKVVEIFKSVDDEGLRRIVAKIEERLDRGKPAKKEDIIRLKRYALDELPRDVLMRIDVYLYMYRVARDLLKRRHLMRKVEYNDISFATACKRLRYRGVCDKDWIVGFFRKNSKLLLEIASFDEINEVLAILVKCGGVPHG